MKTISKSWWSELLCLGGLNVFFADPVCRVCVVQHQVTTCRRSHLRPTPCAWEEFGQPSSGFRRVPPPTCGEREACMNRQSIKTLDGTGRLNVRFRLNLRTSFVRRAPT